MKGKSHLNDTFHFYLPTKPAIRGLNHRNLPGLVPGTYLNMGRLWEKWLETYLNVGRFWENGEF